MEKTCYFIRHGHAMHNKLFWDIGKRAYREFRDTNLLYDGYEQCEDLRNSWKNLKNVELVCVSPCVRTLDTALFTFKNHNVKLIAKDFLIEYPLGGDERETYENLNLRIEKMKQWIKKRPETTITVVSHSSFIGMFKDKKIGDEKNELKHCFPYTVKI